MTSRATDAELRELDAKAFVSAAHGSIPHVAARRAIYDAGRRDADEDIFVLREALRDLVDLNAQDEIGCVPPPTREQWSKAWAAAEELVRVEP